MLPEQIRHHLRHNGHFAAGLRLLALTGEQPHLTSQLQRYLKGKWVPDQAKAQLRSALLAYIRANPAPPAPKGGQPPAGQTRAAGGSPPFRGSGGAGSQYPPPAPKGEQPPDAIAALKAKAKTLHKRHSDLKGRLNLMAEDAENYTDGQRAAVATEIMLQVIPALDDIYDQIRHWEKTGEAPPPPNERSIVQETVAKMNRLQKILPPRISKLKKYLRERKRGGKELSADELAAYEKELLEKETEVERLKQELQI